MVLIKTLDETMDAIIGHDQGNYLEERALLKQLGKILDLDKLYGPLKKHLESGIDFDSLSVDLKKKYNDAVWTGLQLALYNIYPDEYDINKFKEEFESPSISGEKTNRIASLQNHLITYFMEDLKGKSADGILNGNVDDLLTTYEGLLIGPGDCILNEPENNIGLDESREFFELKKQEYRTFVGTFSAVK